MPSGAKKRKAAKNKKEKEASSHNQNHNQEPEPQSDVFHTHENDDLKHHDDKESEGGEVSSTASQDHPTHQHQFTDVEKEDVEKVEGSSHVQISTEDSKSVEEHKANGGAVEEAVVEENVALIDEELKPAGELNGKNITEEYVEAQKKSGDGVVSQSVYEESAVEIERELKILEKVDAPVEHVESLKESESHSDESHVIDKKNVVVENSPFGSSTEAVNSLSEGLSQVPNPIPVGEVCGSVVESRSDTVTDNVGLAGDKINVESSTPGDSLLTSSVVLPVMEENGKKKVDVLDQDERGLPILVDLGLENKRDEAIVVAGDAPRAADAKNIVTQVTEEKSMLLYNAPKDEAANCGNAGNGTDHIKDSEFHESSDTQPLVASAARPVQRTSWMGCCGLFEVLAGSNR